MARKSVTISISLVLSVVSQIIVGAGNEYLLMLLSQILGADRRVAMESPTYVQAYGNFFEFRISESVR